MGATRPSVQGTYKLQEHMPGYTGFVPKLQNSFAHTFAATTRMAMSCPPTPDIETVNYDFLHGKRRLRTASPMPGSGFYGFVQDHGKPPLDMLGQTTTMERLERQYVQGGPVNLASYYDDQQRRVERLKRENPRAITQKRNPVRNISQVPFGDYFYYTGKHMFETTTTETYGHKDSVSARSPADVLRQSEEEHDLAYQYKVAHAMVGRARLDLLHRQVGERVQAKVITGNKDMIRMFNFFAQHKKGMGHGVIGHKQFLCIAQKLGVYMTEREACALFGRYDAEVRGALTYFEFISLYFDENERIVSAIPESD